MTPQELRNSIISKAIAGKLVNQIDEEEPVEVAVFGGDCDELFEIPKSWRWASLKSVVTVNTGLAFKKEEQLDINAGNLRVLRGGNIGDNFNYCFLDNDIFVKKENFAGKFIALKKGDIITPAVTSIEKICKTGYIERDFDSVTAGGFVYIIRVNDDTILYPKYLQYFISSSFNKTQCKPNIHKSGQAFYNLKKSGYIEQPICIPPLEEQKRIVAKVEALLSLADKYEEAWNKLDKFNNKFPDQMFLSILKSAFKGRLTNQDKNESTDELFNFIAAEKTKLINQNEIKKEKKIIPISPEEIPYDIPNNWKWSRLIDFCTDIFSGKSPKYEKNETNYRVIGQAANKPSGIDYSLVKFTNKEFWASNDNKYFLRENDVLLNTLGNGTLGRSGIVDKICYPVLTDGHPFILRTINKTTSLYLFYYLQFKQSDIVKSANGSTNQTFLNLSNTKKWLIPVPPLEEQERIVAKIEVLLPLCRSLK